MAENSKIAWTTHTFNPWRGCSKVSEGCANCYAETLSHRNPKVLGVWGEKGTRVVASESMWKEPLKWDKRAAAAGERHRVFCASLADMFEDGQGQMKTSNGQWAAINRLAGIFTGYYGCNLAGGNDALTMADARTRLFDLIDATPNLDWLLLTKRPQNLGRLYVSEMCRTDDKDSRNPQTVPPHNVWIGISAENQERFDQRWPHLRKIPAKVRFVSYEPAIGPLSINRASMENIYKDRWIQPDWVIAGGESGSGARTFQVEWARSLRIQCQTAGIAFFMKQMGDAPDVEDPQQTMDDTGLVRHRLPLILKADKGGEPEEWPEDLRVREFPCLRN